MNGWANASATRCAIRSEASESPWRRSANSSPPTRATMSPSRTQSTMRRPAPTRRLSATGCPKLSFTSLKSSRSNETTASQRWSRACNVSACDSRSSKTVRFANPVSGSRNARSAASDSRWRFSHAATACRRHTATVRKGTMKRSTPDMTSSGPTVPASMNGAYGSHTDTLGGTERDRRRGTSVERACCAAAARKTRPAAQPMSRTLPVTYVPLTTACANPISAIVVSAKAATTRISTVR